MSEIDLQLENRARFYAALGDPGRLAIVDALTLGDFSPGELAARLGITSNLLAHHLQVLEAAGIVRRSKSEGDRRRNYVHLRSNNSMVTALDLVARPRLDTSLRDRRRVVFVCTQNSARSQLAASYWRHVSSIPVLSAGTHPARRVHAGAVRVARRHGVPFEAPQTRHLADVAAPGDLIVAVCDLVHEELPARPRLHWSVPDPVARANPRDFEAAYVDIVHRIDRLVEALDPQPNDQGEPS